MLIPPKGLFQNMILSTVVLHCALGDGDVVEHGLVGQPVGDCDLRQHDHRGSRNRAISANISQISAEQKSEKIKSIFIVRNELDKQNTNHIKISLIS